MNPERPTQPDEGISAATVARIRREVTEDARESSWWMRQARKGAELTLADLSACAALVVANEIGAAKHILRLHLAREVDARLRELPE